jgi:hypothetical protein
VEKAVLGQESGLDPPREKEEEEESENNTKNVAFLYMMLTNFTT